MRESLERKTGKIGKTGQPLEYVEPDLGTLQMKREHSRLLLGCRYEEGLIL